MLFPDRNFEDHAAAERVLSDIAAPEGLLLARYDPEPAYVGQTLAAIAGKRGTDPAATLLDLIPRLPKLFVLQLQLDLVNLQFVEQPLRVGGGLGKFGIRLLVPPLRAQLCSRTVVEVGQHGKVLLRGSDLAQFSRIAVAAFGSRS